MGRFWAFTLILLVLFSCSKKIYTPVEYKEKIIEKEVIRLDTVEVEVPVEVIREVIPQMDTSIVETSVAVATAYVDTTSKTINHTIKNKPVKLEKEVPCKDTIIEVEKIKEVPVEVEVVKYKRDKIFWISIGLNLLVGLLILRKLGIVKL